MKLDDLMQDPSGIEAEILREKVATLVRVANTLARHVEELHRARDAVLAAEPEKRARCVERFRELREVVETWHWYLIVQREATGLRRHEGLAEHYPIPDLPPVAEAGSS